MLKEILLNFIQSNSMDCESWKLKYFSLQPSEMHLAPLLDTQEQINLALWNSDKNWYYHNVLSSQITTVFNLYKHNVKIAEIYS